MMPLASRQTQTVHTVPRIRGECNKEKGGGGGSCWFLKDNLSLGEHFSSRKYVQLAQLG